MGSDGARKAPFDRVLVASPGIPVENKAAGVAFDAK